MGHTQSGKSTLVNYLAQTPLIACKKQGLRSEYLIKTTSSSEDIAIGSGVSTTLIPFVKPIRGQYYIDTPGCGEMRGSGYAIVQSFSIGSVLKASQLKICLVISQSDLDGTLDRLTTCINYVGQIFPKFGEIKSNVLTVITKTEFGINEQKIKAHFLNLNNNKELREALNSSAKEILSHLAENNTPLSIFPRPESEGPLSNIHREKIIQKIENLEFASNPYFKLPNPLDSAKSMSFSEIQATMYENVCEELKDNIQKLRTVCREKIPFTDTEALIKMFNSLYTIFNYSNRSEITTDIVKKFIQESNLPSYFDFSSIETSQKCLKLKVFSSCESSQVGKIYDSISDPAWRLTSIGDCMRKTDGFLGMFKSPDGVVRITSGVISSKYIKKIVQKYKKEEVHSIVVKNYHTFLIDDDLVFNGKNLVISSSIWAIKGERTIDLSGKKGADHDSSCAKNGAECLSTKAGQNGLPGKPGQYSGHFYGQGKQVISNSYYKKLTIKLNGGDGGRGQDGGKGQNGEDARTNQSDMHRIEKKEENMKKEDMKPLTEDDLKQLFSEDNQKHFSKCLSGSELATYYAQGSIGGVGGNAGKGGKGGYKGKGSLKFTNDHDNNSVIFQQCNGSDGRTGNVGKGGRNGDSLQLECYQRTIHSSDCEKQPDGYIRVLYANRYIDKDAWHKIEVIKNNHQPDGWSADEWGLNDEGIKSCPINPCNLEELIKDIGSVEIPNDYNI